MARVVTKRKTKIEKIPAAPLVVDDVFLAVDMPKNEPKPRLVFWWRHGLIGLAVVVFIGLAGYWFFAGDSLISANITDGQLSAGDQAAMLAKVGRHIVLPEGFPTIAVVADPAAIKSISNFYAEAKKGDVVVIYPHFALIYDEAKDLLVNATMINQQP